MLVEIIWYLEYFLVVMSVACLWELFEFASDTLLGMNLQHSNNGVMDTMIDILVAFIGGILSSIGYYIVKKKIYSRSE